MSEIVNGGGGTPGGANTQLQFNNNGVFGGAAQLTVQGTGYLVAKAAAASNFVLFAQDHTATQNIFYVQDGNPNLVVVQTGTFSSPTYLTATNCSSNASPAVCGSAAAGSVAIAAAATTVQVNTTDVTANSQILLTRDDSLGTKLGVTCNTATVMGEMKVSARVAGTSFTITVQTAPATNPGCISYFIIN